MRSYIVSAVGAYDSETFWTNEDQTPEDVMFDAITRFGSNRMSITIMEVDTLNVVDPEGEGETPGDAYWDFLHDGEDGDTAYGITRLAMWEMDYHLDRV